MYTQIKSDYIVEKYMDASHDKIFNTETYEPLEYFTSASEAIKKAKQLQKPNFDESIHYTVTLKTWLVDLKGRDLLDEPLSEFIIYPEFETIEENKKLHIMNDDGSMFKLNR